MAFKKFMPTKADRLQEKKDLEKQLKYQQKSVEATKAQLDWTKKQLAKKGK